MLQKDPRLVEPRQHLARPAAVWGRAVGKHGGQQAKKTQKSKISEVWEGTERLPPPGGLLPSLGGQFSSLNWRKTSCCPSLPFAHFPLCPDGKIREISEKKDVLVRAGVSKTTCRPLPARRHQRWCRSPAWQPGTGWVRRETLVASITLH